jgi:hypothetical protein
MNDIKDRKAVRITDNSIYGFVETGWGVTPGPCVTYLSLEEEEKNNKNVKPSSEFTGEWVFKNNFG